MTRSRIGLLVVGAIGLSAAYLAYRAQPKSQPRSELVKDVRVVDSAGTKVLNDQSACLERLKTEIGKTLASGLFAESDLYKFVRLLDQPQYCESELPQPVHRTQVPTAAALTIEGGFALNYPLFQDPRLPSFFIWKDGHFFESNAKGEWLRRGAAELPSEGLDSLAASLRAKWKELASKQLPERVQRLFAASRYVAAAETATSLLELDPKSTLGHLARAAAGAEVRQPGQAVAALEPISTDRAAALRTLRETQVFANLFKDSDEFRRFVYDWASLGAKRSDRLKSFTFDEERACSVECSGECKECPEYRIRYSLIRYKDGARFPMTEYKPTSLTENDPPWTGGPIPIVEVSKHLFAAIDDYVYEILPESKSKKLINKGELISDSSAEFPLLIASDWDRQRWRIYSYPGNGKKPQDQGLFEVPNQQSQGWAFDGYWRVRPAGNEFELRDLISDKSFRLARAQEN